MSPLVNQTAGSCPVLWGDETQPRVQELLWQRETGEGAASTYIAIDVLMDRDEPEPEEQAVERHSYPTTT